MDALKSTVMSVQARSEEVSTRTVSVALQFVTLHIDAEPDIRFAVCAEPGCTRLLAWHSPAMMETLKGDAPRDLYCRLHGGVSRVRVME